MSIFFGFKQFLMLSFKIKALFNTSFIIGICGNKKERFKKLQDKKGRTKTVTLYYTQLGAYSIN